LFQAIAEKFIGGDLEIDSFLEQFSARRKVMHLRRVKADKMADMLTKQHNALHLNSASSPVQGYTHHTAPSYMPLPSVTGSMPYPASGMYMPMSGSYGANVF
jgi:ESCRT-I complex subunit VPS37